MTKQLALIDVAEPEWRIDDHTIEIGRQGIEAARRALRAAAPHEWDTDGERPVGFAA